MRFRGIYGCKNLQNAYDIVSSQNKVLFTSYSFSYVHRNIKLHKHPQSITKNIESDVYTCEKYNIRYKNNFIQ